MRQITSDVYMLEHIGPAPAFLLASPDGATLIDTGIFCAVDKLLAEIAATPYGLKDVTQIVLTHCHIDHAGNVAELSQQTHATVIAHQDEMPYLLQQQTLPASSFTKQITFRAMSCAFRIYRMFRAYIQRVDRPVADGEMIDALGGLRVIHVPGHTPGSIALYQPERKLLFSGDIFFHERHLRIAPEIYNVNTSQVVEAARKLAALDIEIACFGHGAPYTEDAGDKLRQFLEQRA